MSKLPALLPEPAEFNMFQTIAKHAQTSGLYSGVGSESKIFMVLLAARELGVSPMLALNGGIWNINGKIEISARLMNGLIRRDGHTMSIKGDDTYCTIIGKRKDTGETHEETFTMDMAVKAQLTKNSTWSKYPADMLYARCMSRLARRLFSDVIGNAYVQGEIDEDNLPEKPDKVEPEKLEQAECEEICTSKEVIVPPNPLLITIEQVNTLNDYMPKCDEQWQTFFKEHMKKTWNADKIEDIPVAEYLPIMKSIQANIQKNIMNIPKEK